MTRSAPRDGSLSDRTTWVPVTEGQSGAIVLRHVAGERYAKLVPAAAASTLQAERDRVEWLAGTGIPGPRVLDWHSSDRGARLVTSTVPGVAADTLDPGDLARAWPSIVDILVRLHDLPACSCPFERTLDQMMALARATVAEGRVQREFLPQHLVETPPAAILESLELELGPRRQQEASEAVVCHGDLCLPNILVDPDALRVTGLIDLGRLGRADPYADIALLLATAREIWDDDDASRAERALASRRGIAALDPERLAFYLRLDPLTW